VAAGCHAHLLLRHRLTRLHAQVLALKVGDGFTPGVAVGPVISAAARDKVEALVQDAVAKGATVLAGGARVAPPGSEGGFFFAPTVLDNVSGACTVAREEIFGPLVRGGRGWWV
jgi:succinate-semialdehyde dehydrogenase / glutarate-semialdehyde dehydrogenase